MGDMVRGSRLIKIKEKLKSVKIVSTGTQFQGATPANITLKATAQNFEADLYRWYNASGSIIGNAQNLIIANNQVTTVNSYRVEVTDLQGNIYQDVTSISKVQDGQIGKPGRVPIQREWTAGHVYRNNDEVVDYIYHRATNTWWRLKDGYDNITATANPDNRFIQLTNVEQMAVNILIAENANIGGFIFKNEKLVSQTLASNGRPNIELDGKTGEVVFQKGTISSFLISKDFITTERIMYTNTKSVMKLGGGGLQVDFYRGNTLFGRIDTTGNQMYGEVYNIMEIKTFGSSSQGVGYNSLYLESEEGRALTAKGRVLLEGSVVLDALTNGDNIGLLGSISVNAGGGNSGMGFTGIKGGLRFVSGIMVG